MLLTSRSIDVSDEVSASEGLLVEAASTLPSGEIEILGRRDTQIKLRGHRVELFLANPNLLNFKEFTDVVQS